MKNQMFTRIRRLRWIIHGSLKIRRAIARAAAKGKVKLIVGASITDYPGWIASDLPHFDLLNKSHWKFFFGNHRADNLLAEHVLEHLTEEQVRGALKNCYAWLKPGGCMRIAVPDANHPSPAYQKLILPPTHGHLSAWNLERMKALLEHCGFNVVPLEYYSPDGQLHTQPLDEYNGHISRSIQRGVFNPEVKDYSSLIVDAIKSR